MKICFLNPEDASQKFLESKYFSVLQPLEISVRTHGKIPLEPDTLSMQRRAQSFYCQNILEFTLIEEKVITWYVSMVCNILQQKAKAFLLPKVSFIKLREFMDWNFPYTMQGAIVLTELKIRELVSAYCAKTPDLLVSGFKTIFHEMVHLHQRKHRTLYQKIYNDFWGFRCVNPEDIQYLSFYIQHWVTNPDTMSTNYVIPIVQSGTNGRTDWYLPLLILDPTNVNLVQGILVEVTPAFDQETQRYRFYTTMKYRTLNSLKEYRELFYGMDRQLYHPDEIMANLLTDWIITDKEYADAGFRSTSFYTMLKKLAQ